MEEETSASLPGVLINDDVLMVLGDLGNLEGVPDNIGFSFKREGKSAVAVINGAFDECLEESCFDHVASLL